MAEHPTEFTRLNKELATQATDVSLNWFRQIAEQNLKQSCGSLQERAREVLVPEMRDDHGQQVRSGEAARRDVERRRRLRDQRRREAACSHYAFGRRKQQTVPTTQDFTHPTSASVKSPWGVAQTEALSRR